MGGFWVALPLALAAVAITGIVCFTVLAYARAMTPPK